MSEIFLSYSHEDRSKIERLANALDAAGFPCWWDREVVGGAHFSQEIEARLNAAKAVIVAWSEHSAQSMWVIDEASIGKDRGTLVPVSLDGTPPPLGFRQVQTIPFAKWAGELDAPEIDSLLQALRKTMSAPAAPAVKKPARRFLWRRRPTALVAAVSAILIGAGASYFLWTHPASKNAPTTYASVAVLPFEIVGEGGDQAALADGVAEEIINALSKSDGLKVVAKTSSFAFRDKEATISEIGKALGAQAILEGTLNRSGERLKLSLRLVDAQSGYNLWSDSFDKAMSDVFDLEEEIARRAAEGLNATLAPGSSRPTSSVDAYEAYLKGRKLVSEGEIDAARTEFEKAVLLDPNFAEAYGHLAQIAFWLADDVEDTAAIEKAKAYIDKADALKPDAPVNIMARIMYLHLGLHDPAAYLREAERGAKLYPNDPEILRWMAQALYNLGEVNRSIPYAERAVDVDPMAEGAARTHMWALALAGRRAEALKAAEDALARFPDTKAQGWAGAVRSMYGDPAGAIEAFFGRLVKNPDNPGPRENIAGALSAYGFRAEAEPVITDEAMRLKILAIDPSRWKEAQDYVKRYKLDIPPELQVQIAYATGYDASLIPELEKEAADQQRFDPTFLPLDLILAYKQNGRVQEYKKTLAEAEKRIALAVEKGANGPRFWEVAALIAGAADNAGLAVQRLDKVLAMRSVDQLGGHGYLLRDPAFAGVKSDPRLVAETARIDAEWNRQRQQIIDSGVLEKLKAFAQTNG